VQNELILELAANIAAGVVKHQQFRLEDLTEANAAAIASASVRLARAIVVEVETVFRRRGEGPPY